MARMRFFAMLALDRTRMGDKDALSKSVDDCHDARRARGQKNAPQPSRRCGKTAERQQRSTRLPLMPIQYRTSLHHNSLRSSTSFEQWRSELFDLIDEQ
jgi:hypothetical protein